MNVLAILESDIIKNVIEDILTDEMAIEEIKVVKPTFDLNKIDYEDIGMIIIDLRNDYEKIVSYIEDVKENYSQIKVIVIDVRKRLDLFKRLVKSSIEGYIVDILDRDEFAYIIHKIIVGKKFYDLDLLEESLKENKNGKDRLTIRENEILDLVGKGFNNKEIGQKLFITENTVKKHVSSIFTKLGFKSRKEVISYLKKKDNMYF
ncbi:MAG: response regulator transcription factor [Intestinibacter sp.]|uniref:helix-turn-helix transcriptional regulator n=1 Tax=Intestinibacter sp. TaxID=1965304 RepID=UPI0025BE60AE|nr:response regulator transcription factor [Intestinibacter sp.]MCI6737284.1 response regulator transcription factor [Intestinibacter sp.]